MILRSIALLIVGLTVAGAVYVRLVPIEAKAWHKDPDRAERSGRPNDYLVADGGDRPAVEAALSPEALFAQVEADLLAQPRMSKLAETPEEGLTTFVQRSRLMAYPDVINVKVTPTEGGSRLAVWSRARFGQSDLGVNQTRVQGMLDRLDLE